MGISESQEAIFERLFEQAEIAAFNKKELHDYRESQKEGNFIAPGGALKYFRNQEEIHPTYVWSPN